MDTSFPAPLPCGWHHSLSVLMGCSERSPWKQIKLLCIAAAKWDRAIGSSSSLPDTVGYSIARRSPGTVKFHMTRRSQPVGSESSETWKCWRCCERSDFALSSFAPGEGDRLRPEFEHPLVWLCLLPPSTLWDAVPPAGHPFFLEVALGGELAIYKSSAVPLANGQEYTLVCFAYNINHSVRFVFSFTRDVLERVLACNGIMNVQLPWKHMSIEQGRRSMIWELNIYMPIFSVHHHPSWAGHHEQIVHGGVLLQNICSSPVD